MANFVGRISTMALAIAFTPFYIQFLGIEAYGLVGFYLTLQASLSFLELGLSRACNRELARHSALGRPHYQRMLDTLRTLEVIYWLVALFIGLSLTLASQWIATSWLGSSTFTNEQLTSVLILVAWVIALRWPVGLYVGAMMGLQRQRMMNVVQVGVSILNWGGSAAALWLIRPDISIFFQWQLFASLCGVLAFGAFAWRAMPGTFNCGRFTSAVLSEIMPFAAGVGGNAILGTMILQADKLMLSAMLPLKEFAYYSLASVIANTASIITNPISNAIFPRFAQLLGANAPASSLSDLYHLSCQAIAVLVVPFSLIVAFFSYEVLYVYTGKVDVAENAARILSVLIIAKALHASMIVPYALQLAHGWVRLSLYINLASVIWLFPAIYVLVNIYGPVGAAVAWLLVTIGYACIGVPLMHRRLLIGEWTRWARFAIASPVVVISLFLTSFRWLIGDLPDDRWYQAMVLVVCGGVGCLLAVISERGIRQWAWSEIAKRGRS